jgi:hypothetical protein
VLQAPAGSAVTVPGADVDGVNTFMLTYAAQSASFNLTCVAQSAALRGTVR